MQWTLDVLEAHHAFAFDFDFVFAQIAGVVLVLFVRRPFLVVRASRIAVAIAWSILRPDGLVCQSLLAIVARSSQMDVHSYFDEDW